MAGRAWVLLVLAAGLLVAAVYLRVPDGDLPTARGPENGRTSPGGAGPTEAEEAGYPPAESLDPAPPQEDRDSREGLISESSKTQVRKMPGGPRGRRVRPQAPRGRPFPETGESHRPSAGAESPSGPEVEQPADGTQTAPPAVPAPEAPEATETPPAVADTPPGMEGPHPLELPRESGAQGGVTGGGGLQRPVLTPPVLLTGPAAEAAPVEVSLDRGMLTPQLRAAAVAGRVVLAVLVRADGTAGAVQVKETSGSDLLDASAVRTAQGWRFRPATRDGVPIEAWAIVPVRFVIP